MIVLGIVLALSLMIGVALCRNHMLKVPVVVICYLSILVLIQLYFKR
jgi:hypothetical protein